MFIGHLMPYEAVQSAKLFYISVPATEMLVEAKNLHFLLA